MRSRNRFRWRFRWRFRRTNFGGLCRAHRRVNDRITAKQIEYCPTCSIVFFVYELHLKMPRAVFLQVTYSIFKGESVHSSPNAWSDRLVGYEFPTLFSLHFSKCRLYGVRKTTTTEHHPSILKGPNKLERRQVNEALNHVAFAYPAKGS